MADHRAPDSPPILYSAELAQRAADAAAAMTLQHVGNMLTMAQAAVQGFEAITTELAAFSRDSLDRTAWAAQAMTAVTSPGELMTMQAAFSRQQAEAAAAEMTRLSGLVIKTARQSLYPAQGTNPRDSGGQ